MSTLFNTTEPLAGKRILLGICGSIAAYKSPELVRALTRLGAEVRVVMTRSAGQFVTPITLQALSGYPVRQDLFAAEEEAAMDHIRLARWPDAVVVAPASAHSLARFALGLGDDLLSTLLLVTRAPVFLAPAMNASMWAHPATQAHARQLCEYGVQLLGPEAGALACGEEGAGRMLEPEQIVAQLHLALAPKMLAGKQILITAGPTWESLDPARGLSNRASGKQGFALAQACAEAGAQVQLISGPSQEATPPGVLRVNVTSAQEMLEATLRALATPTDLFIANAAVADHRPALQSTQKLPKTALSESLTLIVNPDIVSTVNQHALRPRVIVAFAAETRDHLASARNKAAQKGADIIVVNDISHNETGMGAESNACSIIEGSDLTEIPTCSKIDLARHLIRHIAENHFALKVTEHHGTVTNSHS
ncbi:phosphopantothenoylcysteine decarboxylase [Acidithiobacillus marinus]|uniref:Coenzyme A biosynthesis bifunctional protein CoaBC n=1 Tax=Acidithiobacillus marinus TaxID=187490 RepID=A0A2I1DQE0_9PROT|nr:bifunctional phosphopantothenoylcysteine decarboxylase/phosphopantothenate--cysteine ligase CoaBC [Acidithiobacillus marinus]PKY12067.1 phosphopantothenoylcysteine decarboxylase [Acidithiobacillus marinus]